MEAYRMLDSCWTVLGETSRFAQVELENLDSDDWGEEHET